MSPKILVCTVESWNSKVGANTFSSLLANYPAENLANIYIREELPDSLVCSRYFQISESKVIKSILKPAIKTGREVVACQQMTEEDEATLENSRKLYNNNRKKRSVIKLFIREILWKIGRWNTPELNAFVDSFQPDIVVFGMEGYIHFNCICRYVVKRTNAKAIGYFLDDTFTYRQIFSSKAGMFYRYLMRKSLKKLAADCSAFWAITPKTKQEADAFFGVDCQVITKPIDYAPGEKWKPYTPKAPIQMLYTGNLLIGRLQAIQAISKAMERINADGVKIELNVYSASYIPPEEVELLSKHVHMKGVIPQNQVLQLQNEADILVFAEAIEGKNSQDARLSFSTKLTDYFRCGRCILAVGAKNIAPMEYLVAEHAALCASNEEEIYEQLKAITETPERICRIAENAYQCGLKNHSRKSIQTRIDITFEKILRGSKNVTI